MASRDNDVLHFPSTNTEQATSLEPATAHGEIERIISKGGIVEIRIFAEGLSTKDLARIYDMQAVGAINCLFESEPD